MIGCEKCLDAIEALRLGMLHDGALAEMEAHVSACESCRREYDEYTRLAEAVEDAFRTGTLESAAGERVLGRVRAIPDVPATAWPRPRLPWRAAAAVLVAGFALGALATAFSGDLRGMLPGARGKATKLRAAGIDGMVLARHSGDTGWHPIARDTALLLGDEIVTPAKSELVLNWLDGSTLTLSGGSSLTVKALNGVTELELSYGRMRASLTSPHPPFSVITPQGRIRALGTDFTVSVD